MTQQFSFNLVDEAWLPCVRGDGATETFSLRQTLAQSHQLQALAGDSPPQTAALHRFLLAILHRVFGPEDEDEWAELWQAEAFEAGKINAYLDKWRHRFDLFDAERPFYQAADERVRVKSTISLSHDRASGNNSTLFDHHTEATGETLTPAQAARTLITAQSYGLAGLAGIKGQTFTDGTCAGGVIFLVEGDTLKETLLLNMPMYPSDEDVFTHTDEDCPAWEMGNPFEPERNTPLGYLDYLTWQNRRVMFQPEQERDGAIVRSMTMGPALRFDQTTTLDTMKHYRRDDKLGAIAFSFSENRVLWRDSATFFTFQDDDSGKKVRPPATFRWLRELTAPHPGYLEKHKQYRCIALGMSKKQAKVFFFREERLPLPLTYLTDQGLVNSLANALDHTSTIAFDLQQAARRMGMFLQIPNAENKKWGELNRNAKSAINDWVAHTGIERHYWASLDVPFQNFIVALTQDKDRALADWRKQLRKAANAAFEQAAQCVGNDGKSFKAVVRGRGYLNYRLNEVLPKENAANELRQGEVYD